MRDWSRSCGDEHAFDPLGGVGGVLPGVDVTIARLTLHLFIGTLLK
jgi:hypothetical protein